MFVKLMVVRWRVRAGLVACRSFSTPAEGKPAAFRIQESVPVRVAQIASQMGAQGGDAGRSQASESAAGYGREVNGQVP